MKKKQKNDRLGAAKEIYFRLLNRKKKKNLECVSGNSQDQLIEACRRGKSAAQYELYRQYYKAMYNTALRILGDTLEAEDTMQEAFLSAFQRIADYRGEVSFGAWLRRIVVNRAIDELRKRKAWLVQLEKVPEMREAEAETEDFSALRVETVKRAVAQLPDGYRIVFSLHVFEGYDHEEIAQIMNISEAASRSQLCRARKRLSDLLVGMGEKS